jgi:hypothetical protein
MAAGFKFGRKRKLSDFRRAEAVRPRAAGEPLAEIAKSCAASDGYMSGNHCTSTTLISSISSASLKP